jgi:hypothetical protein
MHERVAGHAACSGVSGRRFLLLVEEAFENLDRAPEDGIRQLLLLTERLARCRG